MRGFIYKTLIIAFIFIFWFEFTIGKRLDPIVENINKFTDEQGRKELINKLRKEMRKGLSKENILKEEDRTLIYNFYNKIKAEVNSTEQN